MGQLANTYNYVFFAQYQRTYQVRSPIGTDGERESKKSVLLTRLDEDNYADEITVVLM